MRIAVTACIVFISLLAHAQGGETAAAKAVRPAITVLQFIEDRDRSLTIREIARAADWSGMNSTAVNRGFSRSAFWFRFSASNGTGKTLPYILELSYPLLDRIDLYIPLGPGTFELKTAGDHYPHSQREVRDTTGHAFRLTVPPGDATYFFRVESTSSVNFIARLISEEEYSRRPFNPDIVFYVLLGLLLLANLAFLFLTRDPVILPYAAYLLSYILLQAALSGRGYQYLWPASTWMADHALPLSMGCVFLAGSVFYLLHVEEDIHSPAHISLIAALVTLPALVVTAGTAAFSYGMMIQGATALAAVSLSVLLVSSLVFTFRGSRSAMLVFLGLSLYVVSLALHSLRAFGFFPATLVTEWSIPVGSIVMFVLHSPVFKRFLARRSGTEPKADCSIP